MFESAELGHAIDKTTFRAEVPALRAALLDAQFEVREQARFPVVILISGVDGSGKSETINVLYEWLDPRYLSTLAFSAPSDEERERPYMWRFWRALPAKGRIGIFAGSWYSHPIAERIRGELSRGDLDQRMDQINRFEAMLVNEGALVLKFWFHLSKDAQKQRLKALEKDPRTAWRVTQESWARLKTYDKLQEAAGHVLRMTNTSWAPWIVVEGTDDRYRSLTVGRIVLDALQKRLADSRDQGFPVAPPMAPKTDGLDVLTALDLTHRLEKSAYEAELARWQGRLSELVRHPEFKKHSLILAFEGSDAAGKGGSIRRVTAAMDARQLGRRGRSLRAFRSGVEQTRAGDRLRARCRTRLPHLGLGRRPLFLVVGGRAGADGRHRAACLRRNAARRRTHGRAFPQRAALAQPAGADGSARDLEHQRSRCRDQRRPAVQRILALFPILSATAGDGKQRQVGDCRRCAGRLRHLAHRLGRAW